MVTIVRSLLLVSSVAALSACANFPQQFNEVVAEGQSALGVQQPVAQTAPPPRATPPDYIEADRQLNESYNKLSAQLTPDGQAQLKQEELAWIIARTGTCRHHHVMDYACKTKVTAERTTVLQARLNQPLSPPQAAAAAAPAPVPAPPPAPQGHSITVLATARPWNWRSGGINDAYRFGIDDGTGPAVVRLASINAKPGESLTISYSGGKIELGPGSPATDARGYAGQSANGGNGVSGKPLPSAYMKPYPINLGALVGAFTDANGNILGAPFAVGDGPLSLPIPPGASQLQLGINDDIFGTNNPTVANTGSFKVLVAR